MSEYVSAFRCMGSRVRYEFSFEQRLVALGEVPQ